MTASVAEWRRARQAMLSAQGDPSQRLARHETGMQAADGLPSQAAGVTNISASTVCPPAAHMIAELFYWLQWLRVLLTIACCAAAPVLPTPASTAVDT